MPSRFEEGLFVVSTFITLIDVVGEQFYKDRQHFLRIMLKMMCKVCRQFLFHFDPLEIGAFVSSYASSIIFCVGR